MHTAMDCGFFEHFSLLIAPHFMLNVEEKNLDSPLMLRAAAPASCRRCSLLYPTGYAFGLTLSGCSLLTVLIITQYSY